MLNGIMFTGIASIPRQNTTCGKVSSYENNELKRVIFLVLNFSANVGIFICWKAIFNG